MNLGDVFGRWRRKTEAGSLQFYGGTGTIHRTGHLNVETKNGEVVAVWFRCQLLPFDQVEVTEARADEMRFLGEDLPMIIEGIVLDRGE